VRKRFGWIKKEGEIAKLLALEFSSGAFRRGFSQEIETELVVMATKEDAPPNQQLPKADGH